MGKITACGQIYYEEATMHEMDVQATDSGSLSAHFKVLVEVTGVNDNSPEVTITSVTSPLPEDSFPETVVALLSVRNRDSGDNCKTVCAIHDDAPFDLKQILHNFYELVTQAPWTERRYQSIT